MIGLNLVRMRGAPWLQAVCPKIYVLATEPTKQPDATLRSFLGCFYRIQNQPLYYLGEYCIGTDMGNRKRCK
jgi:hypothetical protein